MSKKNNKNALKHGAFAKEVILIGEDPAEFEELHNSLKKEWVPDGIAEQEKVATLAQYFWRKKRRQRYRHRPALMIAKFDKFHGEFMLSLAGLLEEIKSTDAISEQELLEKLIKVGANRCVPFSVYNKKLTREKFKTDRAWLSAVFDEYWAALEYYKMNVADPRRYCNPLIERELTAEELELDERLDAMIDRTIKSLCQIKTMKGIVLQNQNSSVPNNALKRVESPTIQVMKKCGD